MTSVDLSVLVYLAGAPFAILALLSVWRSRDDAAAKWIWTVMLLVAPIVGFIIWAIAGPRPGGRGGDAPPGRPIMNEPDRPIVEPHPSRRRRREAKRGEAELGEQEKLQRR